MMTKKDFIRHCAETSGCTIKETGEWLEFFLNEIIEVLKTEDELRLNDIGKFTVSEKPVRQGRNPSTGEPMMIPAHKAVKFKVSKVVKDAVK